MRRLVPNRTLRVRVWVRVKWIELFSPSPSHPHPHPPHPQLKGTFSLYSINLWNPEDSPKHPSLVVWSMVTGINNSPLPKQDVPVDKASLLGHRTSELHLSLNKPDCSEIRFVPEVFTEEYCRFVARYLNDRLERCYAQLGPSSLSLGTNILTSKVLLSNFIKAFEPRSFQSFWIRVHSDFHLGQVLFDLA